MESENYFFGTAFPYRVFSVKDCSDGDPKDRVRPARLTYLPAHLRFTFYCELPHLLPCNGVREQPTDR